MPASAQSPAPADAAAPRGPGRLHRALRAGGPFLLAAILIALLVDRTLFGGSGSPAGTGSGVAATQTRAVAAFTAVDLAGDTNVTVRVGAPRSVIVHADDNLLGRVTTSVRSGKLEIGTTPGNLSARTPMFVAVTVPALRSLMLEGDGNISVTGIDARKLTVELPGSGTLHATGRTTAVDVTIDGEGVAMLRGLVARDAQAALGGTGSIMLTVTRSLMARISGSGTVLYGGNPARVTEEVTGSGTIIAG